MSPAWGKPEQSPVVDVELPPGFTPPAGWVHVISPYGRPFDGTGGVMDAPLQHVAFWLRLKATPGCVSRMNHRTDVMHLWIEPCSEAAKLFVQRMLRRLPPGAHDTDPAVKAEVARYLPVRTAIPDPALCEMCGGYTRFDGAARLCGDCGHRITVDLP